MKFKNSKCWKALTKVRTVNVKKTVVVIASALAAGCVSPKLLDMVTPMPVPPMVEEIGYNIPDYKGITTVGAVNFVYDCEVIRLKTFKTSSEAVIEPIRAARQDLITTLALIGVPAAGVAGASMKRKKDYTEKEFQDAKHSKPPTS